MSTHISERPAGLSQPRPGIPLNIGDHFRAHSFRRSELGAWMNPLLMFDHFWMTRDTFGWHAHRGMSAVTYVFEDSPSAHHNSDSMGDHTPIEPGSLHWMVAGAGALHRECPEGDDALVHALQFFVDLPVEQRFNRPYSVHADAGLIPEVVRDGMRVRVVAGRFGDVASPVSLPQPFALYDIFLRDTKQQQIPLPSNWGIWLYALDGNVTVGVGAQTRTLEPLHGLAVGASAEGGTMSIQAEEQAHLVMLGGATVP